MPTPRTDLVTTASLVAENATLRGIIDTLTRALRDLPPGDYPATVQALWQIAQARPPQHPSL